MSFESQGSPSSCAIETSNPAVLNSLYFPGDTSIFLNTALFSVNQAGGLAPPGGMVIIGNVTPTAGNNNSPPGAAALDFTAKANYQAANPKFIPNPGHPGVGFPNFQLYGFQNSDDNTNNWYTLGFMVRDMAGYVIPDPSCLVGNVPTSSIQGYLKKSSCFIAHSGVSVLGK